MELERFWFSGAAKDLALSLELHEAYDAQPRMCYWNAQSSLIRGIEDGCLPAEAVYCEGFSIMPDAPISFEHAWVELPDGTVVDPTLPLPGYAYFCADAYPADRVWEYGCNPTITDYEEIGVIGFTTYGKHWGKMHSSPAWTRARLYAHYACGYPVEWLRQSLGKTPDQLWAEVTEHFAKHYRP